MVKNFIKIRVTVTVVMTALLALFLLSACSGQTDTGNTAAPKILAPVPTQGERVNALVYSTVQIQSKSSGANISRVELWVKAPDKNDELLRSDFPDNGIVLQEWVPQQPGIHTVTVKTVYNDDTVSEQPLQVDVADSLEVSVRVESVEQQTSDAADVFEPPPAAEASPPPPAINANVSADAEIAVVQVQAEQPAAEATPIRRYPPPPAAPGVPYGPTQDQLSPLEPPKCDAAKLIGVYVANTSKRVMITEPDDVPARTVGGTLVHRAWRLQNIGTCTWGLGYELSFYGGRAMGSGGVAFESIFPTDPGRRNAIVDNNMLVVPEGKPNQTAVLEVLLTTPVTPGIHQSYWRMRNPQGVYFGPIMGVTMETVRECTNGTYGAPVINKFEILGVGNVYQPNDPINVVAKQGEAVTLDYNVINASNFDIVIESPTGEVQSTSSSDPSGRVSFAASELGKYTITLYADNGSCTIMAQVYVEVIPKDGELFDLVIILSGTGSSSSANNDIQYSQSVPVGAVQAQWNHFDDETDKFTLMAGTYRRYYYKYCPVVDSVFGWQGHCYMTWSNWESADQTIPLDVGGEGDAQGAAVVTNLETKLCPASYDPSQEEYGVRYVMRAEKGDRPATPEYSNTVDVKCASSSSTLPTEIPSGDAQFNP